MKEWTAELPTLTPGHRICLSGSMLLPHTLGLGGGSNFRWQYNIIYMIGYDARRPRGDPSVFASLFG